MYVGFYTTNTRYLYHHLFLKMIKREKKKPKMKDEEKIIKWTEKAGHNLVIPSGEQNSRVESVAGRQLSPS